MVWHCGSQASAFGEFDGSELRSVIVNVHIGFFNRAWSAAGALMLHSRFSRG